jgi:hypothetical protein
MIGTAVYLRLAPHGFTLMERFVNFIPAEARMRGKREREERERERERERELLRKLRNELQRVPLHCVSRSQLLIYFPLIYFPATRHYDSDAVRFGVMEKRPPIRSGPADVIADRPALTKSL